jgi:hypothetical protein
MALNIPFSIKKSGMCCSLDNFCFFINITCIYYYLIHIEFCNVTSCDMQNMKYFFCDVDFFIWNIKSYSYSETVVQNNLCRATPLKGKDFGYWCLILFWEDLILSFCKEVIVLQRVSLLSFTVIFYIYQVSKKIISIFRYS